MLHILPIVSLLLVVAQSFPSFCDPTWVNASLCDGDNACLFGECTGQGDFAAFLPPDLSGCGVCSNITECIGYPYCNVNDTCYPGQMCNTSNPLYQINTGCDGVCYGDIIFTNNTNCTMFGYCDPNGNDCGTNEYCDLFYGPPESGCGSCMENFNCTMYGYCDMYGDCPNGQLCDTDYPYDNCAGLCMDEVNCTGSFGTYCDMYGDGCFTDFGYYCSNETYLNCRKCMSNETTTMYNCTALDYECDEYNAANDCAFDEYCDTYMGNCGMCTPYGFGMDTTMGMVNCTMYFGIGYCDINEDSCEDDEYCDGTHADYNCGMCMSFGMDTTSMMMNINCTMYGYCDEDGDDCGDDEYCDGSQIPSYNCGVCMSDDMSTTMDMESMDMTTTDDMSMDDMTTTDDMDMDDMTTTDSDDSMSMDDTDDMEMKSTMDMDGMATTDDDSKIPEAACTFTVIIATIFGTAVYGFM